MIIEALLVAAFSFGKTFVGIITRPYETYRRIVDHGHISELIYVGLMLALYFALAAIVKTASFRPFLLTKQFVLLAAAAALTYGVAVCLIWQVGKLIGGKGRFTSFLIAWGYTLVPTVLWFLATSLLYVILPPPRTESLAGVTFSILFLVFSTTLLIWKIILSYLSLRFSLHLDLVRILIVAAICGPMLGFYSMLMYRWGIFKVPFL